MVTFICILKMLYSESADSTIIPRNKCQNVKQNLDTTVLCDKPLSCAVVKLP